LFKSTENLDSPMARRLSHVFVVFLAALITSGAGLLYYGTQTPSPSWLRLIVCVSAVIAGLSFAGWVLCNFMAHTRASQALSQRVD
tara:strand:+ start:1179 stop:1436 length:258 start_codon:yes stop_codon:yes gene_type:complete